MDLLDRKKRPDETFLNGMDSPFVHGFQMIDIDHIQILPNDLEGLVSIGRSTKELAVVATMHGKIDYVSINVNGKFATKESVASCACFGYVGGQYFPCPESIHNRNVTANASIYGLDSSIR